MKLNTLTKLMKWFSAISLACAATSLVGVPVDIGYNGSLADESGSLLDGEYFIKFAIASEDATTFYWNNEDGSAATGIPTASVSVDVVQGIFSTVLEGVDSSVLANEDAFLWVFVSDAADGTFESLGAAPINSVPYAVVAGVAESVDAANITGSLSADTIADGSINAEKLGLISLNFPQLDADGVPGGDSKEVNIAEMLHSIADNSQVALNAVRETDGDLALVFLREDWPINNGASSSTFVNPFPVTWPYDWNSGLMPHLDVLDADGDSLIDGSGTQVPGITFVRQMVDLDGDGFKEERLAVKGEPTDSGDYTVFVRATTSWGHHYIREYKILVREVFVDASGIIGYRRNKSGAVTNDGGAGLNVIGGDQTWFQFTTTEPLTEVTTVRWKKDGSTVATISGDTGRTFYVNSANGDGTSPSGGARKIDEDPEGNFVNDEGEYSAEILFDWGQTLAIGMDELVYIDDGIEFSTTSGLVYETPNAATDLFDLFMPAGASLGDGNPFVDGEDFYFGFTPAPDDPDPLFQETIEAGEDDKKLVVQNVFGSAADEYVYGNMQYQWYQQRYRFVVDVGWMEVTNVIQNMTIVDQDVDNDIDLDLDGFGALLPAGTTTLHDTRVNDGVNVPVTNVGVFAGIASSEPTNTYPDDVTSANHRWLMADGSSFTFYNTMPQRPMGPTAIPQSLQERVIYWVYVNNGFIDKIVPQAAVVEINENINIANDLVSRSQVAGYPVTIGGDFGTTNNQVYPPMFPSDAQPGVNNIAYWWQPDVVSNGWEFVNANLANSITILGPYAENRDVNGNNDIPVQLTLHSGYAQETTMADVSIQSDVVVWDMYAQWIDLETDPIVAGPEERVSLSIDAGDEVRLTLQAYVRPSRIFNVGDDGRYGALGRTVTAKFFLLPDATGVPVQLTTNITMTLSSDDDLDAWDSLPVDGSVEQGGATNHVPALNEAGGEEFHRERIVWEAIVENPLISYAVTNVATGVLYAEITSYKDGIPVNSFTTLPGRADSLMQTAGPDTIDGTLDANIDMPLELNLVVNPVP